jgi:5-methylthioadenosine/S-adenosylhomocysteine deaminase
LKILLDNIGVIPMSADKAYIENAYLIIEGQYIKEIGKGSAPAGDYDQVIDGRDRVVLPGFINTHTHAAMTLLRGYADDMPLMDWLENKIWPLEAKLTADDVYWGTMLAISEMIRSGSVCFADMYFFMDAAARAVEKSGIRAVLSRGMVGVGPENEIAFAESREMVDKWHNACNGRITCRLGPHAPYTCPPDYLQRVMKLSDELGVGLHIHIAETRGEFEDIQRIYGNTPVVHLDNLGLFERPVLGAHCVHLTDEDIEILAAKQVGVAHNPESNMKLASGIAPIQQMLDAGIRVALGTDGASSNNNLDMLEEMRSASYLQKVHLMNPTAIPAYQAMQMATINGAIALGLGNETGQLKPGYKADMIIMSFKQPHMLPAYDPIANIVYAAQASDVETVIVDGNILMQDRIIKAFDEKEVLAKARETAQRLVGR